MNRSALVLASGVLTLAMPGCGWSGDKAETVTFEEGDVGSSMTGDDPVSPGGLDRAPPISLPSLLGDPELDLDGIPEASVPVALTKYLEQVAMVVAEEVGPDLYAGSRLDLPDSSDVAVTIFGTDVKRLSDALDRIATHERDRFTVVASDYSLSELELFVTDADARLADAGIEATAWVGMGHIGVSVVTPDGQPEPELERAARAALGDLPFELEFAGPSVSIDS